MGFTPPSHGRKADGRTNVHRVGTKHSPETKAKIARSQKGHVCSPSTRAKMRLRATGRQLPPETRLKISLAMRKHFHQESPDQDQLERLKARLEHRAELRAEHHRAAIAAAANPVEGTTEELMEELWNIRNRLNIWIEEHKTEHGRTLSLEELEFAGTASPEHHLFQRYRDVANAIRQRD